MNKKFIFTNIKPTNNLEFEELSKQNYHQLISLFKDDSNPIIRKDYQNIEKAENYYNAYQYFRNKSPEKSGCDWLFKLQGTGEYIGLLNLYDLTLDTTSDYHKMCSIGYLTGEKYRKKGLTKKAVQALINYIFTQLKLEYILAVTTNDNVASRALLQSLGFLINTKDYNEDLGNKYFELRKS